MAPRRVTDHGPSKVDSALWSALPGIGRLAALLGSGPCLGPGRPTGCRELFPALDRGLAAGHLTVPGMVRGNVSSVWMAKVYTSALCKEY